ncbi:MAG: hypothetical protein ABI882_17895 [Acidobacteriota bacterium]
MNAATQLLDGIPAALVCERTLSICLKCGFDLMTRQMGLALRTAYSEMKKFVPSLAAFRTTPQRPLFASGDDEAKCPYCGGAKRWIASLVALEIDGHKDTRKQVNRVITLAKRKPAEYTILKDTRSSIQVFSDWLERTSVGLNFNGQMWLRDAALSYLQRHAPAADWTGSENIGRILLSRRLTEGWEKDSTKLFLSPSLYGDILVVQYLVGRTHLHGGLTFEGRLTPFELFHRLRRFGYLDNRGIDVEEPTLFLENAIAKLAEDGEIKPQVIIDRTAYLQRLKTLYDKKK